MQNYFDEIKNYQIKDTTLENPGKGLLMLLPGIILTLMFAIYGTAQLIDHLNNAEAATEKTRPPATTQTVTTTSSNQSVI